MKKHHLKIAIALIAIFTLFAAVAAQAADIPAGTRVTVRLSQAVSSATSHTGDTISGSLANDVVVNGNAIAKAGAPVKGRVTLAKPSGRLHNPGIIAIRLTSVDGNAVSSSSVSRKGAGHTKSNATKIGGGAAAGALIGALAGGGKGAAIGAGVGAGAGTGVAMATGKKDVVIPAESALTFTVSGGAASAARRR
jgi:hypothetical protein